ncbi:MAG TPA: hypothetical protein VFR23_10630 [Jiangellaceae bacterium]|nr:hypothetical protein [Jiangellaceae bacterium]
MIDRVVLERLDNGGFPWSLRIPECLDAQVCAEQLPMAPGT